MVAIGLGSQNVSSQTDPISLPIPAISVKTISGGTITDIYVALTITLGNADLTTSTLYVQLYSASPFISKEFHPIPNTQMIIELPMYPQIGVVYTASLKDLFIKIEPETQLILGFYNTANGVQYTFSAHLSAVVKMK